MAAPKKAYSQYFVGAWRYSVVKMPVMSAARNAQAGFAATNDIGTNHSSPAVWVRWDEMNVPTGFRRVELSRVVANFVNGAVL